MGSMMAILFAEKGGCQISVYDPSEDNLKTAATHAEDAGFKKQIDIFHDYDSLCKSLDSPRVFLLSIPHGNVADMVIDSLKPYLTHGDIIIDGSNENYLATQRRQGEMSNMGVSWIGMGVSGGYQSARSGPSMSPGGPEHAINAVLPLLEKVAARDPSGKPCVAKMGPGGCGHYVKTVHNGIEQGMMSALCETWGLMHKCLGMSYDEIGSYFEKWTSDGELKGNFLVSIGVDICRQEDPESHKRVLGEIKDKVVQDVDETEGTGIWTSEEGMRLHVPIPTITSAHQFRLASAKAAQRQRIQETMRGSLAEVQKIKVDDKARFVEDLRMATYTAFLASFIQGLILLEKADQENRWDMDFTNIINIWRAGCIIRSEYISNILEKVYQGNKSEKNPLFSKVVTDELKKGYPSLRLTVSKAVEADACVPALSGTLEYLKYATVAQGPTQFMEAELDYFGAHMFDLKSEPAGGAETGKHHFGWKPAKGIPEQKEVTGR